MEHAGCQNGLVPFKVKNAGGLVSREEAVKSISAYVATVDP